jgi:hypothetical protein
MEEGELERESVSRSPPLRGKTSLIIMCGLPGAGIVHTLASHSASGKSTLANELREKMSLRDTVVKCITYDEIEQSLSSGTWSSGVWHQARLAVCLLTPVTN